MANTSSVDGRSAFLREDLNYNNVQYFQSFNKFREPGLPTKLPAEEEVALKQNPQLLDLENNIRKLQENQASDYNIKAARNQLQSQTRKVIKDRLKQFIGEWVRNRRDWKVVTRGRERSDDS